MSYCAYIHREPISLMIEAYLDESGISNSPICIIAGYYGGKGAWKIFDMEWKKLLSDFNVPLDKFHAHEIMMDRGFFQGWEKAKLQAFKRQTGETIARQRKIHPISATIIADDFNSYSQEHRAHFTGKTVFKGRKTAATGKANTPYFAPFWYCVREVARYASVGGKVHFFCGLNTTFARYATVLYQTIQNSPRRTKWGDWKDRLGNIAFPAAKNTPQLQAADFLAYLQYRHTVKAYKAGKLGQTEAFPLLKRCWANGRSTEDFRILDRTYFDAALAEVFGEIETRHPSRAESGI